MARILRWLGVLAFLCIPVALLNGRPEADCGGPPTCMDPVRMAPGWLAPTVVGLVLGGLALLLLATLFSLDKD